MIWKGALVVSPTFIFSLTPPLEFRGRPKITNVFMYDAYAAASYMYGSSSPVLVIMSSWMWFQHPVQSDPLTDPIVYHWL